MRKLLSTLVVVFGLGLLAIPHINAQDIQRARNVLSNPAVNGFLCFVNAGVCDTYIVRSNSGTVSISSTGGATPGAIVGGTTLSLGVNAGTGTWTLQQSGDFQAASNTYRLSWSGGGIWGIPKVGRVVGATGAQAAVVTFTLPATDGSYEVSTNVVATVSTTHAFNVECAYTDETNVARIITLQFEHAGAFATSIAATSTVPYHGVPLHLRVKASTVITLRTQAAGTYTTVTYNIDGVIRQIA